MWAASPHVQDLPQEGKQHCPLRDTHTRRWGCGGCHLPDKHGNDRGKVGPARGWAGPCHAIAAAKSPQRRTRERRGLAAGRARCL